MTRYPIIIGWTAARQRRLEAVAADRHAPRGMGPTGFHCMHFGWTKWRRPNDDYCGEVLTEEGGRVLAEWKAAGRSSDG